MSFAAKDTVDINGLMILLDPFQLRTLDGASFDTHELNNRGDGFLIFAAVCKVAIFQSFSSTAQLALNRHIQYKC